MVPVTLEIAHPVKKRSKPKVVEIRTSGEYGKVPMFGACNGEYDPDHSQKKWLDTHGALYLTTTRMQEGDAIKAAELVYAELVYRRSHRQIGGEEKRGVTAWDPLADTRERLHVMAEFADDENLGRPG